MAFILPVLEIAHAHTSNNTKKQYRQGSNAGNIIHSFLYALILGE